ncbi:MAG TPA: transketolase [Candidatus Limnocylindrales bacterium]|nr:transketolase [Candidatus Limnocylindrales bacterium]
MTEPLDPDALRAIAKQVRVHCLRSVGRAGAGHIGGPLSAAEILVALYFRILRIRPEEPDWPDRDRFILSKGHSSIALYATMALRGYFPVEELATFDAMGSRLQGHPDMTRLPGLDMSTGSLGMGLSVGLGMALGARLRGGRERVYVLLGDGECQEGEVWEAAFTASRYGLSNLIAIVDANGLQQYGWPGDAPGERQGPWPPGALVGQWSAFGWRVIEADGHDVPGLISALESAARPSGAPVVVIARTTKGHGVSFIDGRYEWHARVPTDDEVERALEELDAAS